MRAVSQTEYPINQEQTISDPIENLGLSDNLPEELSQKRKNPVLQDGTQPP